MRCRISARAFISMVTSSIEVYKKECLGVVLGKIKRGRSGLIHITSAINVQTAYRGYDEVSIATLRENRIKEALNFVSGYKIVGQFHSHPDSFGTLSKLDRKLLKQSDHEITVVLVVKENNKIIKWKKNKDKSISGTVGGKYYVRIVVYYDGGKKSKIKRVNIDCPYLKKLNKLIGRCARYEKGVCVWEK